MKKFLIILVLIISVVFPCKLFAEEVNVLSAGVEFNWVNMLQFQRDEAIEFYRKKIFDEGNVVQIKKKDFRNEYKEYLKDKDYKTHYRLASYDVKETKDVNMSAFFKNIKGQEILYLYALQYKNNLRRAYYYSVLGALYYVDIMSDNYPDFPYYSVQYRSNGKIAGTIYFVSRDLQYTYDYDGKFKYVWYKDKMYDRKGKELLTRTNW